MYDNNHEDYWLFSEIPGIEEASFNKVLEKFYDNGVEGLIRENIQNSLDGKLLDSKEPVKVIINTGTINKNLIPGINEIRDRINCLNGRNLYTRETIKHMKSKMDEENVPYISFEDQNTKGLKGADQGQSDAKDNTWSAYAYNKGVHFEDENSDVEQSRGGSHGIGKIASNAASDLYMMYFANCDESGNKHLGGTVQLIEHKFNEQYYRSTGYFTKKNYETKKFYPYENTFSDVFKKDTRGLKIIIPFLREQFNDEKKIITSICDNFFIAILEGKLVVEVNNKIIDNATIEKYILNPSYYEQDISNIKSVFTPLYYKTYTGLKPQKINIPSIEQEYKFQLFFNYDEKITKGRVGIIRTIGMKIEDKKIKSNVNKPFNAILIPESIKEDAFLKSLENESHTEITSKHIKDQKLQKNAKRFINNLDKEIAKVIENEINTRNPIEGKINTDNILYLVENQFKSKLKETFNQVKIKDKGKEKTIVAVTGGSTNSGKTKDRKKVEKSIGEKRKRESKEVIPGNNNEDSNKKVYITRPDIVERLIVNDKEYIKINFTEDRKINTKTSCDVSFSLVDGLGDESKDQFLIADNYNKVTDVLTGKEYCIQDNKIKDISIHKGVIQLQFNIKPNYNKALKFIYYVEV